MNMMQKSSAKYLQPISKNTLKRAYTMIKMASFQGCKNASTYANE
jgi:hypothetical protein